MNKLVFLLLVIVCSYPIHAIEATDITAVAFDRPIWASGLSDASWIFQKIERKTKLAIFDFSVSYMNMPKNESEEKENDIGRNSRSLPLYIMERLFLQTDLYVVNYVLCYKNVGPVVSGVRTSGMELNKQLKDKFDYILTGTIEKNYLDLITSIKIYLYDKKTNKEDLLVKLDTVDKSTAQTGAEIATEAVQKISDFSHANSNINSEIFKKPNSLILSNYLDGIGQLLMQSLVQNKIMSYKSLWGEDDMLNWYKTLWNNDPNNNCIKFVYFKGIIASIDYGGEAYKSHVSDLKSYMALNNSNSDYMVALSPLLYKKTNDIVNLNVINNYNFYINSDDYHNWLNRVLLN